MRVGALYVKSFCKVIGLVSSTSRVGVAYGNFIFAKLIRWTYNTFQILFFTDDSM
jgi:hypothetical protein